MMKRLQRFSKYKIIFSTKKCRAYVKYQIKRILPEKKNSRFWNRCDELQADLI